MIRRIIAVCLLLIAVLLLTVVMSSGKSPGAADRDFICYWASGRLLAEHHNPYDPVGVLALERSAGWLAAEPMVMAMTPFSLPVILLVGPLGPRGGLVLWAMLILAAIMVSVRLLWKLHGKPAGSLHLTAYCFAPTMACVMAGQAAVFVLLGLTLFLYFVNRKPFVAGLGLTLCLMKPQLLLPFAVALVVWIVYRRVHPVLMGLAAGVIALTAVTAWFDPLVWQHYLAMMTSTRVNERFIPDLSVLFRLAINRNLAWLQAVPAIFGAIWAGWYALRNRSEWDWQRHGNLLLLVSVAIAPYAWFTDEVLAWPALLAGLYYASDLGRSKLPFLLPAGASLVLVLFGVSITSGIYIWTSLAWLLAYVLLTREPRSIQAREVASPAVS